MFYGKMPPLSVCYVNMTLWSHGWCFTFSLCHMHDHPQHVCEAYVPVPICVSGVQEAPATLEDSVMVNKFLYLMTSLSWGLGFLPPTPI